jgi:hypothetical protein
MRISKTGKTVLEEESAVVSKQERYREETGGTIRCSICGKNGHPTAHFSQKEPPG